MSEITQILCSINEGKPDAAGRLLPLVYDQLRELATHRMAREKPGQTLQATALVHEAYVRLVDVDQAQRWDSRRHFFAAAAEAMRRILIEQSRRKMSLRAGGEYIRVELQDEPNSPQMTSADDLLALDEALTKLEEVDPASAELVKLRFFAGLTVQEAADSLGVSPRTVKRNWAFARAWLQREIDGE
jgi:RNA polymerase sigma factor (TIGR02999 family)